MIYNPYTMEAREILQPHGVFGATELYVLTDGKWQCVYRKYAWGDFVGSAAAVSLLVFLVYVLIASVL